MEEKIIYITSIVITVIIELIIVSQFTEERYKRTYDKKGIYAGLKIVMGIILVAVNLLHIPIANVLIWIAVLAVWTGFFYYHETKKIWMCILEVEVLFFVYASCETVGYIILNLLLMILGITDIPLIMQEGLAATFSNVLVIFIYYLLIARVWKNEKNLHYTPSQYITHGVIAVYTVVNIAVIVYLSPEREQYNMQYLLLLNMLCIVFADMYFLYFIKCIARNHQLEEEKNLLEQQAKMQYAHYKDENEKYQQSLKILHDVKKHLKMINSLWENGEQKQAQDYTQQISEMLAPLVPEQYTDQPILNILLLDKKRQAERAQIDFQVDIGAIELSFMESIDVTTIFGNLLDNAIEAASKVNGQRYVSIKISSFNDFIVASIENTMLDRNIHSNSRPETVKDGNHGYGLLNVENVLEKYSGNIQYESSCGKFSAKIMLCSAKL